MSSILEALKKLEAEKAARLVSEDEPVSEFVPERAAESLAPPPPPPGAQRHVPASALLMGGIIFAVALIAVSGMISLAIVRHSENRTVVATTPAAASQHVTPPAPSAKKAQAPKPPAPVAEETKVAKEPPKPAPKPDKKPAAVEPNPPEPQLPPVNVNIPEEKGPSVPADAAEFARVADKPPAKAAEPEPAKAAATPPPKVPTEVIDIRKLPILKSSDRARFGLENMRLNVLREASESRPHGLAIINLNKVYIGEMIPGTHARLIDVKSHGIGIEIADTGERFYVQH